MKRLIKYPLAILFALLMGYSQVFAYLGPTSAPRIKGDHGTIQIPVPVQSVFDNAVFGELEDEDHRTSFNDTLVIPSEFTHNLIGSVIDPFPRNAHLRLLDYSRDSWLRFRVIRL